MKFIYVQNYLTTSKETKLDFFKALGKIQEARVVNQKIILNDNSLLLELDDTTNIDSVKKSIEVFFKNFQNIKVRIVNKILQNNKKIVLNFNDKEAKEVSL